MFYGVPIIKMVLVLAQRVGKGGRIPHKLCAFILHTPRELTKTNHTSQRTWRAERKVK